MSVELHWTIIITPRNCYLEPRYAAAPVVIIHTLLLGGLSVSYHNVLFCSRYYRFNWMLGRVGRVVFIFVWFFFVLLYERQTSVFQPRPSPFDIRVTLSTVLPVVVMASDANLHRRRTSILVSTCHPHSFRTVVVNSSIA